MVKLSDTWKPSIDWTPAEVVVVMARKAPWSKLPDSLFVGNTFTSMLSHVPYLQSWDSMTYCSMPPGDCLSMLKKFFAIPEVWGTSLFWVEYTLYGFDYIPFSYPCPKGWDSIETYTPQ